MSVLDRFVAIRRYRARAAEFRNLAERASLATVRSRYLTIASHYNVLAASEELSDKLRSAERLRELRLQRETSAFSESGFDQVLQ